MCRCEALDELPSGAHARKIPRTQGGIPRTHRGTHVEVLELSGALPGVLNAELDAAVAHFLRPCLDKVLRYPLQRRGGVV